MGKVSNIEDRQKERRLERFRWLKEFIITKPDDPSFIDFTEEGRAYYEKWFARYGYPLELMNSFETFSKTVRQILRNRVHEAPEIDDSTPLGKAVKEAIDQGDFQRLIDIADQAREGNVTLVKPIR